MKRILKITGLLLGALLLIGLIWGILAHESLPEGKSGPEADALAQKMLNALNHEKYQNARFLSWSYRAGANQYQWDKKQGVCAVSWKGHEVVLNLAKPETSKVTSNSPLTEEEKQEIIQKAVKMFNNDSFWLVAPYKVFDQGTKRSIVILEDGSKGLLVTYSTGGSTPGDSYLWLLNDNGFPNAWKMWVNILPVGGIKASWDDWIITQSGAYLPKTHKLGPLDLDMGNVEARN